MKKILAFFVMLAFSTASLTQTLQIEDTINITRERWRDTCFGLINNDATQIPSGYLMDYSLTGFNEDFDGVDIYQKDNFLE